MKLRHLTDDELDLSASTAADNERVCLSLVLEHISEVFRRKSFSPKYKSIREYVMKQMKYDDKSAWCRINAANLMTELPDIKGSIENGELDLSKLVEVHNFVRNENVEKQSEPSLFGEEPPKKKMTKEEKLKVVEAVTGKTSREAKRILLEKSSDPEKLKIKEQVKPMKNNSNQVTLNLADTDLAELEALRNLLAHKIPNASLSELVSYALKQARTSIEKSKTRCAADASNTAPEKSRTPSAKLKREIYTRSKGQCELCGSKHATQYDHIMPWAKGGKTSQENMRLLCRNCNQREGIKNFGVYEKHAQ